LFLTFYFDTNNNRVSRLSSFNYYRPVHDSDCPFDRLVGRFPNEYNRTNETSRAIAENDTGNDRKIDRRTRRWTKSTWENSINSNVMLKNGNVELFENKKNVEFYEKRVLFPIDHE